MTAVTDLQYAVVVPTVGRASLHAAARPGSPVPAGRPRWRSWWSTTGPATSSR